jgi:hypothetical protein
MMIRMKDKLLFIGLPIALIVVFAMHWIASRQEGFQQQTKTELPNLDSCPGNLTRATDNSAVICCEGEVAGGKCKGVPKCTLSAVAGGLPRCVDYIRTAGLSKSMRFCPRSMPNYYEVGGKGICTAGALKVNGTGPVDENAKKCKVYDTVGERFMDHESCYNVRLLDEFKVTKVKGPVQKFISSGEKTKTNIVPSYAVAFYKDGIIIKRCIDRKSGESALDVLYPGWRSGNNAEYTNDISKLIEWCN